MGAGSLIPAPPSYSRLFWLNPFSEPDKAEIMIKTIFHLRNLRLRGRHHAVIHGGDGSDCPLGPLDASNFVERQEGQRCHGSKSPKV